MVKSPKCQCPHTQTLFMLLGKKWVMFLLQAVDEGAHSFTDIRHHVGEVNTKILTDRLAELVSCAILEKRESGYFLTSSGRELTERLLDISHWWAESHPDLITPN